LTGNLCAPDRPRWLAIATARSRRSSMGVNLAVYKTSAFAYSPR